LSHTLKEGINIQLHHSYSTTVRGILPLYKPIATIDLPCNYNN
jgi:hypothetical protein